MGSQPNHRDRHTSDRDRQPTDSERAQSMTEIMCTSSADVSVGFWFSTVVKLTIAETIPCDAYLSTLCMPSRDEGVLDRRQMGQYAHVLRKSWGPRLSALQVSVTVWKARDRNMWIDADRQAGFDWSGERKPGSDWSTWSNITIMCLSILFHFNYYFQLSLHYGFVLNICIFSRQIASTKQKKKKKKNAYRSHRGSAESRKTE